MFHTIAFFIDDKKDEEVTKFFSINRQDGSVYFECHVEPPKKKCLNRDGTNGKDGKDLYNLFFLLRDNNGTGKSPNKSKQDGTLIEDHRTIRSNLLCWNIRNAQFVTTILILLPRKTHFRT